MRDKTRSLSEQSYPLSPFKWKGCFETESKLMCQNESIVPGNWSTEACVNVRRP